MKLRTIALSVLTLLSFAGFISCITDLAENGGGTSVEVVGRVIYSDSTVAVNTNAALYYSSSENSNPEQIAIVKTDSNGVFQFEGGLVDSGYYIVKGYDLNGNMVISDIFSSADDRVDLGTLTLDKFGAVYCAVMVNDPSITNFQVRADIHKGMIRIYPTVYPQKTFHIANGILPIASDTIDSIPYGRYRFTCSIDYLDSNMNIKSTHRIFDEEVDVPSGDTLFIPMIILNGERNSADSMAAVSIFRKAGYDTVSIQPDQFNSVNGRLSDIWVDAKVELTFKDIENELSVLNGLHNLYLRNIKGDSLPQAICNMKDLVYLDISGAGLSFIPDEITGLKKLEALYLSDNLFEEIPCPDLILTTDSSQIKKVYLEGNPIKQYDWSIQEKINGLYDAREITFVHPQRPTIQYPEFEALRSILSVNGIDDLMFKYIYILMDTVLRLDLTGQVISSLPAEIGTLSELEELTITDNRLDSLPFEIGSCSNLNSVKITNGTLRMLPESLSSLKKLRYIDFSNNELTEFPIWIDSLPELAYADFVLNRIQILPDAGLYGGKVSVYYQKGSTPDQFSGTVLAEDTAIVNDIIMMSRVESCRYYYVQNSRVSILSVPLYYGMSNYDTIMEMAAGLDSLKVLLLALPDNHGGALIDPGRNFENLEELVIVNGSIFMLPDSFAVRFPGLKRLALCGQSFTDLPSVIKDLPELSELDMFGNRLHGLPAQDSLFIDARSYKNRFARENPFSPYSDTAETWQESQR